MSRGRCGRPVRRVGTEQTMVLYHSPPGHDHDDNCRCVHLRCDGGHDTRVMKRNSCPAEGCGWVGRQSCWCHDDPKVDDVPARCPYEGEDDAP